MSMPRFNDYREITAKRSGTGTCGHAIRKGDVIGYYPPRSRGYSSGSTQCADCWARWRAENAAADLDEAMMGGGYGY